MKLPNQNGANPSTKSANLESSISSSSPQTACAQAITFVIPARNEERCLEACLKSINKLALPDGIQRLEIIVVDNESTDRTASIARNNGAKIFCTPPLSAAHARNVGASNASGSVLAFVDADCELDENWLVVCYEHLKRDEIIAVGTTMASPDVDAGFVEQFCCRLMRGNAAKETAFQEVQWLPTFNLMLEREPFETCGGFDEGLVTCEDCDLGTRLRFHGKLIRENQSPTKHSGESTTIPELFRREAWRARGYIPFAHRTGYRLRDVVSILIPLMYMSIVLVGMISIPIAMYSTQALGVLGCCFLGAAAIPAFMLARKRMLPLHLGRLCENFFLMSVLLMAQAVGLVIPARRLERSTCL